MGLSITLWIILGVLVGWIASIIMRRNAQANIVVGIIGALLGAFLMSLIAAPGTTGFNLYSIIVSVFGAIILILFFYLGVKSHKASHVNTPQLQSVRSNLVGRTLGKYRIIARLGRGGMAEVYKAYQPSLDRYVSIKVLHSHLFDDQDFIGRFGREALTTGKLRHPNIVPVLDFDQDGDVYFMAMEYIDGTTLKNELKARKAAGQPFSLQEISRIFTALCSAVDYAHRRNMVHRDIKPANVMINQKGQVILTDFGIARIIGGTQYTQIGALSGTPAYMSPEQGQGERGDERGDIYALGVMLYEMTTGIVPYDADTPFAVIMKHISEPLPLPTTMNPNVPESVERIILKAMSKNPDDRYQTAGELATALRDAVGLLPDDTLETNPLTSIVSLSKDQKVIQDGYAKNPVMQKKNYDADNTASSALPPQSQFSGLPQDTLSIQQEITNVSRRLQKLKEIQALKGIDMEPHYLIEIEDLERKLIDLQEQLKTKRV